MEDTMKNYINKYKSYLFFGSILGSYLTLIVGSTVNVTTPELGITCIEAEGIFGDKVPAGCYKGNIKEIGNKINHSATCKYQNISC